VSYGKIGRKHEGGHEVIRHTDKEYARVREDGLVIHTNTAESFFALLKRGHYGVFHQLSKKHLHRYCNEFGFRWDHRHVTDGERMVAALKGAEGSGGEAIDLSATKRNSGGIILFIILINWRRAIWLS